jgi:hypothetical protein
MSVQFVGDGAADAGDCLRKLEPRELSMEWFEKEEIR